MVILTVSDFDNLSVVRCLLCIPGYAWTGQNHQSKYIPPSITSAELFTFATKKWKRMNNKLDAASLDVTQLDQVKKRRGDLYALRWKKIQEFGKLWMKNYMTVARVPIHDFKDCSDKSNQLLTTTFLASHAGISKSVLTRIQESPLGHSKDILETINSQIKGVLEKGLGRADWDRPTTGKFCTIYLTILPTMILFRALQLGNRASLTQG